MRSPFGQADSCVGWPRVVAGDAARTDSRVIDIAYRVATLQIIESKNENKNENEIRVLSA